MSQDKDGNPKNSMRVKIVFGPTENECMEVDAFYIRVENGILNLKAYEQNPYEKIKDKQKLLCVRGYGFNMSVVKYYVITDFDKLWR